MENIKFPIAFTTIVMLSANLIPLFGVAYALVAFLLLIGPILLLWMVYRTLRDGVSSKKTFDAHWYEDREL
jgi:membrane protein implicated in regulation of membrane protease activity